MSTISMKSSAPDIVLPLLNNAIEREKSIIRNSIAKSQQRVEALSRELSVDAEELSTGRVSHSEDNDMDLIELEGELELLRHLQEELRELESIEVCV